MKTHALRNLFLVAAILLSSALPFSGQAVLAQGGPSPDTLETALLAQLEQATGGQLRVSYHSETGNVRFLGGEPGRALTRALAGPEGASPEAAARAFLASYGSLFGLRDPNAELAVMREQTLADGRAFVRFQQQYQGVPVVGGELIVQSGADRAIVSANGEILPDLDLDVIPTVAPDRAQEIALSAIAKGYDLSVDELTAGEPELWIYNPALLGGPGIRMNALVWRLEVTPNELRPIRELVLIDAHLGSVALHFNQVHSALDRVVYDNDNDHTAGLPGNGPVRSEGAPASGIADADYAYDYAGDTYDFFFDEHGRDSLDDAGMQLVSTTRYCPDAGNCPYANAFWNGQQMAYGDGYASGDDVVGHELAHGVTDFSSHLFYWYQSGAINESLSDVWGEFVDLTNGAGDDSAGVRWLMGEDIPIGAIRDMQDPTAFGDPDKITSANYWCDPDDSGGVHINSGVNNKAAYLMTDGDTFNGKTVTGLGISKVADLYYEVQTNMLTSGSDYQDLYDSLIQAGINLGYSAADRQEIQDALDAVEMNELPCSHPADAPVCGPGLSPVYLFNDDLENPGSGNWATGAIVGSSNFYYPQNPNPYSAFFDPTNTTSGDYNFWGYNYFAAADFYIAMTSDVALPADAYMHFSHAWEFEDLFGIWAYDGGVVEYSTNGGGTWTDAGTLFTHNGYNATLETGGGNPLEGRDAFGMASFGYTSSRLDLSSLAGDSVRFRFRIGTDNGSDRYGWFIDDIRVYTCSAAPPAGINVTPTSLTVGEPSGSQTFKVTLDSMPSANVTIGLSTSNAQCSVSPSSLTLTAANWNTGATATVTAVNDDRDDGNKACTVQTAAAVSADGDYDGVNPDDVTVTVQDDDTAGVTLSKSAVNVAEGGAGATYTVVLDSEPLSNVTITLATSGDAAVSPTTLSFTAANWDTPKTVSVTAVDDGADEGAHSDTVAHTATSADAGYNGIAIGDVTVNITDNDAGVQRLYLPVMIR